MSDVKFKVRYNSLVLQEFTVEEMIRATGLNPESIRTELQRMRQEGLLISFPSPKSIEKRGAPPSLYRISNDPEKRLALSESVEGFYPSLPSSDEPTSQYYHSAQRLIDQAQNTNPKKRKQLIIDAKSHLDRAEHAEGLSLASDAIKNYIRFERARLAYLNGRFQDAEEILTEVRIFFIAAHKDSMIRYVDEYKICIGTCIRFAEGIPNQYGTEEWAQCLIETLEENSFNTDSPLLLLLIDLLKKMQPQSPNKELLATVFHAIRESSKSSSRERERLMDYTDLTRPFFIDNSFLEHRRKDEENRPIPIQEIISDWQTPSQNYDG